MNFILSKLQLELRKLRSQETGWGHSSAGHAWSVRERLLATRVSPVDHVIQTEYKKMLLHPSPALTMVEFDSAHLPSCRDANSGGTVIVTELLVYLVRIWNNCVTG